MNSFFEKAKDKLEAIKETASESIQTDFLDQIKDYGEDKINDTWEAINKGSEVLQKTGYRITALDINMGIPPTMTIELLHERDVDDMEIKKLIIAHQKEKVLHALLIAILQADKMQKKMDVGTFNFVGIGIEIGLAIPKMKLKFKRI